MSQSIPQATPPQASPAPAPDGPAKVAQSSALNTTFVGLSVVQVYSVVDWLSTWPVHAPSGDVKMTFTVLAIGLAHFAGKLAVAKWPILATVTKSDS